MRIILDKYQLTDILKRAAQLGAESALEQSGLVKPYLTQTSAYKKYGRRIVDKWIKEGRVTIHKQGDRNSKVLIDRLELSAAAKGDELIVYFKHAA
jgi:hypothetical protein